MSESHELGVRKGAALQVEDRRRSQRVVIRVPVTVQLTLEGQDVAFTAHTVAVNDQGAMLAAPRSLPLGAELDITNERTRQSARARVTRTPPESSEGFLIPVEFTVATPGFWQISFPPKDWKPID